jgi:2-oxoglutarate dehydrogenase E2 component (dihydrolipoamide succinyltransferase)
MATEVNLPELGESVTEGTVTRWLKQVGDEVAVDEALLEVSTDKVDTEIPSPVAGTLLEIRAQEDDTVEVGAVLAVIGASDEAGGDSGGGDEGGQPEQAAAESAQEAEAEAEPEPEPASEAEPEPEPEPEAESQPEPQAEAETPLEEEQTQQDQAHEQAERADTPAEPAAAESAPSSGGGDSTVVNLPALGESVTEGTVTRWLKQVGDEVAADESLLEVSTDKVDTEIPSPVAGTLLEIKVNEDETVEVGTALAVIGSADAGGSGGGEDAPAPTEEASTAEAAPAEPQQEESAPETEAATEQPPAQEPEESAPEPEPASAHASSGEREASAYVTPLVRKMAAQHGVDLAAVVGTGVGGRIRKQDVLDAAAQQGTETTPTRPAAAAAAAAEPAQAAAPAASAPAPAAPAPAASAAPAAGTPAAPAASAAPSPLRGKTEPMSRLRKVIASRMVESLQTMAQLTTVVEVDVTAISRLRDAVKADFATREGVKLSYMPFFAKAAIDALKQHPSLNAAIDTEKGEVTYYDRENLAIAVDTERGLLTPVIKDAGDLSIAGLARKIADVAERTRTNKITPDELSGGTFTITNTGSRGALFDTPIINLPQVAILGTGSVVKRAVVIDDPNLGETIAVRQMVYLALTYDHRLVDGADAARFLTDVKGRLEAGQFEV